MSQLARITSNPRQCGGRPCVRGMRIRVADVLDLLEAGLSPAQIVDELPDLEPDDIRACIAFARARVDHPVLAAAARDLAHLWQHLGGPAQGNPAKEPPRRDGTHRPRRAAGGNTLNGLPTFPQEHPPARATLLHPSPFPASAIHPLLTGAAPSW